MQTTISNELIKTLAGKRAEKILKSCVHCGFCLATCPTYQLLGNELDSPRGRIYLIKSAFEGNDFSDSSLQHLDRCLTCRSCETTCPSGVEYGNLLDVGRELIEPKRPLWQKLYRFTVRKFLTTPLLFNSVGIILRHSRAKGELTKANKVHGTVLLLGGCVQPTLAPNINHSIKNILSKLGYDAIETPQKECCGAVDHHLSATKDALSKVKYNIDKWLEAEAEVIISSASGCGVMVKDYLSMFDESDPYHKKAQAVAKKTKDIAQFLADKDLSKLELEKKTISYHEPCTLQHGQGLKGLVESILSRLGYKLGDVVDSHLCCGSAGTYSIFQPKLSKQLKINKLRNLQKSSPEIIVTSNIGCLMHLQGGTKIPVKHWVELLDA